LNWGVDPFDRHVDPFISDGDPFIWDAGSYKGRVGSAGNEVSPSGRQVNPADLVRESFQSKVEAGGLQGDAANDEVSPAQRPALPLHSNRNPVKSPAFPIRRPDGGDELEENPVGAKVETARVARSGVRFLRMSFWRQVVTLRDASPTFSNLTLA
jgi:hypothetical protein